ncbi:MAG: hypothetical protein ACYDBB_16290 [Armatimonadota bacterium]
MRNRELPQFFDGIDEAYGEINRYRASGDPRLTDIQDPFAESGKEHILLAIIDRDETHCLRMIWQQHESTPSLSIGVWELHEGDAWVDDPQKTITLQWKELTLFIAGMVAATEELSRAVTEGGRA